MLLQLSPTMLKRFQPPWHLRELGGMVDAGDLKSPVRKGRAGSSPAVRTTITHCFCSLFWISRNIDPANSYTRSYTGFGGGR